VITVAQCEREAAQLGRAASAEPVLMVRAAPLEADDATTLAALAAWHIIGPAEPQPNFGELPAERYRAYEQKGHTARKAAHNALFAKWVVAHPGPVYALDGAKFNTTRAIREVCDVPVLVANPKLGHEDAIGGGCVFTGTFAQLLTTARMPGHIVLDGTALFKGQKRHPYSIPELDIEFALAQGLLAHNGGRLWVTVGRIGVKGAAARAAEKIDRRCIALGREHGYALRRVFKHHDDKVVTLMFVAG
jgi:hypothetical protein